MEWASRLAGLLGGVHNAGIIHRFAAVITFGYFTFHVVLNDPNEGKATYTYHGLYLWKKLLNVQQTGFN